MNLDIFIMNLNVHVKDDQSNHGKSVRNHSHVKIINYKGAGYHSYLKHLCNHVEMT